jgi:hypothetical protein
VVGRKRQLARAVWREVIDHAAMLVLSFTAAVIITAVISLCRTALSPFLAWLPAFSSSGTSAGAGGDRDRDH